MRCGGAVSLRARPLLITFGYGGPSLGVAGGIGNAIDRFVRGYVVDLIDPTFIDFPVFNVADIGVTIGIVLFMASLIASSRRVEHGSPDQS